jgi:asparagine synthase (glutamine-hydrolysing)
LSGAGGDELFNGYSHINYLRKIYSIRAFFRLLPLKIVSQMVGNYLPYKFRKALLIFAHSDSLSDMLDIYRSANMFHSFSNSSINRDVGIWGRRFNGKTDVARFCSYYEVTNYLRFRLLRDSDWASMAHGLELRLPFVDLHFLRDVSIYFRRLSLISKVSLFREFRRLSLPGWIFTRKKTGFNIPFVGNNGSVSSNSYKSRMNYLYRIKNEFLMSLFYRK